MLDSGALDGREELPLLLTEDGPVPLYQQLRYQLSYLITSGRLERGARLPPVRELAERCGVNPGTVAQAYKELQQDGLVVSHTGRGSFVAEGARDRGEEARRQELLSAALDRACRRALALGFGEGEVRQRFATLVGRPDRERAVAFVGPTATIARKYADLLERHFAGRVRVTALTFDELEERDPGTLRLFELVYHVVTFTLAAKGVKALLDDAGVPCRVIGINTEVTAPTLAMLGGLDPEAATCLVTQERYLHLSLGLLAAHSRLRPEAVTTVFDRDRSAVEAAVGGAAVVVYTFGVRDLLNEVGVAAGKRRELVFDVAADSLSELGDALFPDARPHGAREAEAV